MSSVVQRRATFGGLRFTIFLTFSITAALASGLILMAGGDSLLNLVTVLGCLILALYLIKEIVRDQFIKKILRTPRRKHPCIEDDGDWLPINCSREGVSVHGHVKWKTGKAPLVLVIHGWGASSASSRNRVAHLDGHHLLTLDLRGHGHGPHDPEFTAVKCVADAVSLLQSLPIERIESIVIYGHSLGGFIGLRLVSGPQEWLKELVNGLILESAMTDYNLIFEEMSKGPGSMIQAILKGWLQAAWQKIHPEFTGNGAEVVRIPGWGMPDVNTLIIQPIEDDTLGSRHHQLLLQHIKVKHEVHVLDDLKHTGDSLHAGRNRIVTDFLARLK